MKKYFELIILVFFLLYSSIAYGQENKLSAFIDKFVSSEILFDNRESTEDWNATAYLITLSKKDLRLVRNAIFARYGYIFKDADLKAFFGNRKWYTPTIKNIAEIDLSDVDKANIDFIKSLESDPSVEDFVQLFRKSTLPLTIPTKSGEQTETNDHKFPPGYLIKYFQKNPLLVLYPLELVTRNSIFIAIIYMEPQAAGAGQYIYTLATFTPAGKIISELRIGIVGGDLSEWSSFNAVIDDKLVIRIRETSTSSEDGTEEGTETIHKDTAYSILSTGIFRELSRKESKSSRKK